MGPWEYLGIFEYPDLETAFRVLGKIAKLEVFGRDRDVSPQRTSRCSGRRSSSANLLAGGNDGGRHEAGLRLPTCRPDTS